MRQREWIPVLAIIVAVAIIAIGLSFAGMYAVEVFRAYSRADKSMLFWMFPFGLVGFGLMVFGCLYGWVGWRARRGGATAYRLSVAGLKLVALVMALLIVGVGLRSL